MRLSRIGPRAAAGLVVAGFFLSRVVYFALGVRFDTSPLLTFWQYIDPVLLRHQLLSSVWNFHAQPPVPNLYLGTVLKLGGDHSRFVFAAVQVALGLAGALVLYALIRRLGASPLLAAVVSLAFFASPGTVLYENWLYVEYVCVVALLVAALCLHLFADGRGTRFAVVAFSALAAVVLVRTLFHPLWLLAVVGIVWLLLPGRRRQVLAAAAVPVLIVAAIQVKDFAQFGNTSLTSCTGLSVWRVTTAQLSDADRRALVAKGTISSYALSLPLLLPVTRPAIFRAEPKRGVPVLDRPRKSTGAANVGHAAYLHICAQYLRDGLRVARERPGAFRRGVQEGVEIYWRPASQYQLFDKRNRDAVAPIERAVSVGIGQIDRDPGSTDYALGAQLDQVAWVIVVAYALAFVLGIRLLVRTRRRREAPSPTAVVTAFVLFTVAYVTLVGNLLEAGENNRFHFALDPLVLALLAGWAAGWRASRRGQPAGAG